MKNKIYYGKAIYGKDEISASLNIEKEITLLNGWRKRQKNRKNCC